jgi:hypothetical protein
MGAVGKLVRCFDPVLSAMKKCEACTIKPVAVQMKLWK